MEHRGFSGESYMVRNLKAFASHDKWHRKELSTSTWETLQCFLRIRSHMSKRQELPGDGQVERAHRCGGRQLEESQAEQASVGASWWSSGESSKGS